MFYLKKLLSRFFFPVPLCAGFLLAGFVLWRFTKWKKLGKGSILSGTGLLLLSGYPWLPMFGLRLLESRYEPVTLGSTNSYLKSPVYICVLGQGISADANRPANSRIKEASLQRIAEGVRLSRMFDSSKLLVSIAGSNVSVTDKQKVLQELFLIFGLPSDSGEICATARDTEDEIAWFKQAVGTNTVFLVSCASHLPRAMLLADKHQLRAIPAPSGYLVDQSDSSDFNPSRLFPSSANVYRTERAMNEFLGIAWEKIRAVLNERAFQSAPKR